MRRYETIVILDPDLGEERRTPIFDRIRELVPQKGGLVVEFDEWGARKMAYEIKKKKRGFYLRVDYCGTGELVSEMERQFRIDDRVLKYMTILLEDDVDMERIQEKMSPANEAAEPTVTDAPSTAPPKDAAASNADAQPATAATTESAEDTEPAAAKEDE